MEVYRDLYIELTIVMHGHYEAMERKLKKLSKTIDWKTTRSERLPYFI